MEAEATYKAIEAQDDYKVELFHVVCIFMIASVIGLVSEVLVSFVLDGRWESRVGFVIGPFSPLYGCGAVFMTLLGAPLRDKPLLAQFAVIGIGCGMLECFAGWFFETSFGIVAWSYSSVPLNIHGWTCVAMMVLWGAVGVIWVRWVLPLLLEIIERIPTGVRAPLTACLLTFILADSVLTLVCIDCWFWREAGYPVTTPVQQFCATYFGDDIMHERFETMGMWTSLASR